MNTAPDRVSADLRRYESEQDDTEQFNAKVDAEAHELAQDLIESPLDLAEMVLGHDLDIFGQIARCMREFDQAAAGNPIARNACLNALSHIQKIVAAKALEVVRDKAIRNIEERDAARGE